MPARSTAGSKIPVPELIAGDHVPPTSGVPPSSENKSVEGSVVHSVIAPLVPASGKVQLIQSTTSVGVTEDILGVNTASPTSE